MADIRWVRSRKLNGANGIRTRDLLLAKQALSHLSYGPALGVPSSTSIPAEHPCGSARRAGSRPSEDRMPAYGRPSRARAARPPSIRATFHSVSTGITRDPRRPTPREAPDPPGLPPASTACRATTELLPASRVFDAACFSVKHCLRERAEGGLGGPVASCTFPQDRALQFRRTPATDQEPSGCDP